MSADVDLDHVTIRFGGFTAVENVSLKIGGGEFFSILGPSGCGKTTLLRTISGFLDPTEGAVRIGGQDMSGIGSNKRPTALIFQNLALFPLMSVAENIGYGLRVRGVPKRERRRKADELLAPRRAARPGRQETSASCRAGRSSASRSRARSRSNRRCCCSTSRFRRSICRLRQHMRAELRAIQKRVGITFIYITHDQGEALTMSDRIAVMNRGRVEQVGDGRAVYDQPGDAVRRLLRRREQRPHRRRRSRRSTALATLDTALGRPAGRAGAGLIPGAPATLFIRPEALKLAAPGATPDLTADVGSRRLRGQFHACRACARPTARR